MWPWSGVIWRHLDTLLGEAGDAGTPPRVGRCPDSRERLGCPWALTAERSDVIGEATRQQGFEHHATGLFRLSVHAAQGAAQDFQALVDVPVAVLDQAIGVENELAALGYFHLGGREGETAQAQW
jgi:hypothetical protein